MTKFLSDDLPEYVIAAKYPPFIVTISTSGSSDNVVEALKKAQEIGMITVGFTGKKASLMDDFCDMIIKVPSEDTPRIQEMHILIGHIISSIVEKNYIEN